MIAQVLNKDFLLQAATVVQEDLERELKRRSKPGRRRAAGELDELGSDEIGEVAGELAGMTAKHEPLEAAPEGGEPSDEQGARPKDDFAYVPRDALLSLIQTTIEEHVEESDEVEVEKAPMPDDRRGGEEPAVTDDRIADFELTRTRSGRRKFGDMEVAKNKLFSDPGWLTSGFAMAVRAFRGRVKWEEKPPVVPIGNEARIILVGDWGSGIPRAKKVADRIAGVLKEDESKDRHVIHLGDVYYSGSKREYERNFLNLWPVGEDEDVGSYSLCGNHDMYYGGHAYYGTLLADKRLTRQGGSSFFALKNDHWQVLGLDTGYEDGGLQGAQADWARSLIQGAPDHRTALLSHHQLFSAHESGARKLGERIEPVLSTDRVDAWFWGHEHRCIQYSATEWNGHRVGFSSCVGHGGIPEYLVMKEGETKPAPWAYEYLTPYGTAEEPWEKFGFAVLDLSGPQMRVRYIDENGNQHHEVKKVVAG
jgi:3',5'-cyclic AMP phosphodiesterase CpdA